MLIVHLFVSYAHVNLCHFFSSSCCQGLAATSVCGSSWTFLFTFFHGSQIEFGFITMRQTVSRIVMYECCLQRRKVEQFES